MSKPDSNKQKSRKCNSSLREKGWEMRIPGQKGRGEAEARTGAGEKSGNPKAARGNVDLF